MDPRWGRAYLFAGPLGARVSSSCQCGKRLVEARNEEIAVRKHGGVSIGSGVGDAGAGVRC